jgi:methylmalonyl-CoA mutase N-terminal domain/subunit
VDFSQDLIDKVAQGKEEWAARAAQSPCADDRQFITVSGTPVQPLYTPLDIQHLDYEKDIGFPGSFPFTRGVRDAMYRGKLWTMRQFAGLGSAKQTNERFHYLLAHGQTGLSVAFDLPTLMVYHSDHPRSKGEVGRCGVAVDSLRDMEVSLSGIPLDRISTSMTINAPASILLAMYSAVAEKQGVPSRQLTGTIQNDILKDST